jgi:hypothetical protein
MGLKDKYKGLPVSVRRPKEECCKVHNSLCSRQNWSIFHRFKQPKCSSDFMSVLGAILHASRGSQCDNLILFMKRGNWPQNVP